jgi:integrase/recombinase XerD
MNAVLVKDTSFAQGLHGFMTKLSKGGKYTYSFIIRHFLRYLEDTGREIDFNTIKEYIIKVNSDPSVSTSTKRLRKAALKHCIRKFMQNADVKTLMMMDRALKQLDDDPETKSPGVGTHQVTRDMTISEFEYEKLLDGARSEKQRRFLEFLFNSGCRVSEMLGIRLRDVQICDDIVKVKVRGKGSKTRKYKERVILIPIELYQDITATFKGETYLFSTSSGRPYHRAYVSNQIAKLGRAILGKKISAHTMRHSFVTCMIRRTGDIAGVSRYVGHSSVSITLNLYCHSELKQEDIFKPYFHYKGRKSA